eukprot:5054639-Amphidinium_carterae.2
MDNSLKAPGKATSGCTWCATQSGNHLRNKVGQSTPPLAQSSPCKSRSSQPQTLRPLVQNLQHPFCTSVWSYCQLRMQHPPPWELHQGHVSTSCQLQLLELPSAGVPPAAQ